MDRGGRKHILGLWQGATRDDMPLFATTYLMIWKGGDMVQRWAVAAMSRAEKKFKRVKGYREIPKLIAALQQKNLDRKEVAT